MTQDYVWLGIGLLGQAFFSARFLVQWIASERARKSVVPRAFWLFSVGGGVTLLAYFVAAIGFPVPETPAQSPHACGQQVCCCGSAGSAINAQSIVAMIGRMSVFVLCCRRL